MPALINCRRTPIYHALFLRQQALLATREVTAGLTVGLATVIMGLGVALPAAAEQATEWDCKPDPDGNGWDFKQKVNQLAPNSAIASTSSSADSLTQNTLAQTLGWVERELLTPQQQAQIAAGCCGLYISPNQQGGNNTDPDTSPIDVSADWQQHSKSLITLKDNVSITQGSRQLNSDIGVMDSSTKLANFEGNIKLSEPGLLMLGDSVQLNIESGAIDIDNTRFVFTEAGIRGTADTLSRSNEQQYRIEEVTYTSCPPDSNAWQLVSGSIDVDTNENVAVARNVRIEVQDVPILYLPWVRFPLGDERVTGLLFPNLSVGGRNGLDFSLPYYINLADNYDLTLTPRYIQERGSMIEAEFRHLSNWSYTELNASWLGNDKGGDRGTNALESTVDQDRWWRNLNHTGSIAIDDSSHFTTEVDYTQVSDNLYIRDLGINTLEENSSTHLGQKIALGYNTEHWEFGLKGEQFQTIFLNPQQPIREPYKQLPRLDINGSYQLGSGLSLNLKHHAVAFAHSDDDIFQTGNRARADWGLEWNNQRDWSFFKSGAELRHVRYQLDENNSSLSDTSPSATVPVAWIDSGLFFERNGGTYTQTLEPRLFLLYAQQEDQSLLPDFDTSERTFGYSSLWRSDRFSGGDRIGDSKQASLGLTTRLLDDNGGERLRASIGQIFYFEDRFTTLNDLLTADRINNPLLLDSNGNGTLDVDDNLLNENNIERTLIDLNSLTRDKSPIAAELMWRFSNRWQLLGDTTWDHSRRRIDKGSAALRYNAGNNQIVNLGYRFTRNTARAVRDATDVPPISLQDQSIKQGDISTIFPLRGNLNLIARWNYDFTNKRNLETFAGVEYNSCCWRISIVARRWIRRDDLRLLPSSSLDEDEGIFFQIQLKGLAGTSSKVDELLSEGIYGYQAVEN